MVRVTENTYQLLQIEAKRRKKPISQTADALIIAGMELDSEVRAVPSTKPVKQRPLPKPRDLQAQIDAIVTKPAAQSELEGPDTRYAVFVEITGTIIREKLTFDEAEKFLADHNVEGDLTMGPMS